MLINHKKESEKLTPPDVAVAHNQEAIVLSLLAHGANVNTMKSGITPLHRAAAYGHVYIMNILLAHGAQVSLRDIKGETPLDTAKYTAGLGRDRDIFANIIQILEPLHELKLYYQ